MARIVGRFDGKIGSLTLAGAGVVKSVPGKKKGWLKRLWERVVEFFKKVF